MPEAEKVEIKAIELRAELAPLFNQVYLEITGAHEVVELAHEIEAKIAKALRQRDRETESRVWGLAADTIIFSKVAYHSSDCDCEWCEFVTIFRHKSQEVAKEVV